MLDILTSLTGAQVIGWVAVTLMSVLIVASRKHYSVDVVIAWYVVPLVYWTLQRHYSTKRRFSDSATSLDELSAEEDIEMGLPMKVSAFSPSCHEDCRVWGLLKAAAALECTAAVHRLD